MVGVARRSHLQAIDILDRVQGTTERHAAHDVFIFIGADANTDCLPEAAARDKRGYVLAGVDIPADVRDSSIGRDPYLLETSVPACERAKIHAGGVWKRRPPARGCHLRLTD